VKQRQREEHDIVFPHPIEGHLHLLGEVREQVPVGQHDALRLARGPGGIGENRQIVFPQRRRRRDTVGGVEAEGVVEDEAAHGVARRARRPGTELARADQNRRPGVADDRADLGLGEAGVQRNHDPARAQGAEVRDREARYVRHRHRDPVSGTNPQRREAGRNAAGGDI
jgi:hypothetical protein